MNESHKPRKMKSNLREMNDDEVPELIDSLTIDDAEEDKGKPGTNSTRIPLTLITGFLGAGKSTLLQHILTQYHGYRIAVIMNEFGDTADIEGSFHVEEYFNTDSNGAGKAISVSEGSTGSKNANPLSTDVLELANGCLCCSIKDTGVAAIEKLMKKKGAFDYIILETTGLADPGPIASIFWQNEEFPSALGKDIYLDSVICVVDGIFGLKQLEEDHSSSGIGESLRQIASADILIINKIDIANPSNLSALKSRARAINPHVPMYETTRGAIDVEKIIGLDAFRSRAFLASSDLPQDHHSYGDSHEHAHKIYSLQINLPHLTEEQHERLDEWLRTVLWELRLPPLDVNKERGGELEVLRTKGFFTTPDGSFIIQGVRELYEITQLGSENEEPLTGKLVLIGKGLTESVKSNFTTFVKI